MSLIQIVRLRSLEVKKKLLNSFLNLMKKSTEISGKINEGVNQNYRKIFKVHTFKNIN